MSETKKNLNIEDLENVAGGVAANTKDNLNEKILTEKINAISMTDASSTPLHTAGNANALLAEVNAIAAKCGHKPFASVAEAKAWVKATKSPMSPSRNSGRFI